MGISLAKKYSAWFDKKGGERVLSIFLMFFPFVRDAYVHGKLSEIVSFLFWELSHTLGLFPKKKYLSFNNSEVLAIGHGRLHGSSFEESISRFFLSKGLNIIRSDFTWKLLFITNSGEIYGCLLVHPKCLYKSIDKGKSVAFVEEFFEDITSIFVSSTNTIFVCVKGVVYHSVDNGRSFKRSLNLSSAESCIWFNHGMTEASDKTIMVGEYGGVLHQGGWRSVAYLYSTSDNGETWGKSDFLLKQGINQHVHLVRYSKLLNSILLTDGDNEKKLWVGASLKSFGLEDLKWVPINKLHIQMGGYTSIADTDENILLGTDYLGGTNFIVETKDCERFIKTIVPDPYRRSPITNMVQRKSKKRNEIWATIHSSISSNIKCLLMYTIDGGNSWNKVIEYDGTTHNVSLISSSNEIANVLYLSITSELENNCVVYTVVDYCGTLCADGGML